MTIKIYADSGIDYEQLMELVRAIEELNNKFTQLNIKIQSIQTDVHNINQSIKKEV